MWEVLILYTEEKEEEEEKENEEGWWWWWWMVDEDRRDVQESQGQNCIDIRRAYAGAKSVLFCIR